MKDVGRENASLRGVSEANDEAIPNRVFKCISAEVHELGQRS